MSLDGLDASPRGGEEEMEGDCRSIGGEGKGDCEMLVGDG